MGIVMKRKGSLLRRSGRPGSLASRGDFLSGAIRTLYGPRQRPDAGEGFSGYSVPGDWTPAGYLLRTPQVAWLTVSMRMFDFTGYAYTPDPVYRSYEIKVFGPEYVYWQVGDSPAPWSTSGTWSYGVFSDGAGTGIDLVYAEGYTLTNGYYYYAYYPNPDGPQVYVSHDVDPPPPAYHVVIPCPYVDEYNRVLGEYQAAKATVESLRPGRTWVEVVEPWKRNDPYDFRKYFLSSSWSTSIYFHMIAPRPGPDYFGVEFLHIFTGTPSSTYRGPLEYPVPGYTDDTFNRGVARLMDMKGSAGPGEVEKFASFGVRVYGMTAAVAVFPPYSNPPFTYTDHPSFAVSETHGTGPLLSGTFETTTVTVPWVRQRTDGDIAASRSSWATLVNGEINTINYNNAHANDNGNSWLRFSCENLAARGLDFEYSGTSEAVTASSIVHQIAEHFGFDPDTGRDVG